MTRILLALALLLTTPALAHAQSAPKAGPVPVSTSAMAIFAGGCFWCMESEFEHEKGVSDVTSGYAGGEGPAPTYEQVSTGESGFIESVAVTYDPSVVSYEKLLNIYWSNVDPFDERGQFCDKGSQYVAAIFTSTPAEQKLAQDSLKKVETKFGKPVATKILPQTTFYPAEEKHQDFYKKSAAHYKLYRAGCGRDRTLEKIWGEKTE